MKKERLDKILVELGYFESREKAKRGIMAGLVFVDGQREDKAGTTFSVDREFTVKGADCPYVSRGGLKLAKAIDLWNISLDGATTMDIGASTGGFTDCMLQNGASKVYSIDVGYGQLDWKLREDPRVVNIEKCNVRYFECPELEEQIDFISIDVSFISLSHIFPIVKTMLKENGKTVALVKPQFEAGREQVGKNGIVKDPKVHEEVIEKIITYARNYGLYPINLSYSPVKGAKGNIEYLLYLEKTLDLSYNDLCIHEVVMASHETL
ncbi:MAG: TlyA family RNA methyltransferase [Clostridiales bacterium]|nr:TlyA family RNA methyltransferase [Clostridiales bacterium]